MAKKYNDARAVKRTKSSPAAAKEVTIDKKTIKKIGKSPILIVNFHKPCVLVFKQ